MSRYVLKALPPVRAFVIAACLSLLGIILAVASWLLHWPTAITIVGAVGLGLGVLMALAAAISMDKLQVIVDLDHEGYHIHGAGLNRQGRWAEVTKITQTPDHKHITIHHGKVERTHLLVPGGAEDEVITEMIADLAHHLNG